MMRAPLVMERLVPPALETTYGRAPLMDASWKVPPSVMLGSVPPTPVELSDPLLQATARSSAMQTRLIALLEACAASCDAVASRAQLLDIAAFDGEQP
jgi:hypothetical protein